MEAPTIGQLVAIGCVVCFALGWICGGQR